MLVKGDPGDYHYLHPTMSGLVVSEYHKLDNTCTLYLSGYYNSTIPSYHTKPTYSIRPWSMIYICCATYYTEMIIQTVTHIESPPKYILT